MGKNDRGHAKDFGLDDARREEGSTHDVLTTLMAEVCAIINSRPITAIPSDPDDL